MRKEDPPVVVDQYYTTQANSVWAAITEPAQMRQWFFPNIPAFEAKPGFETAFVVENEGRTFTHQWKVTGADEGRMVRFDWSYAEYDGDAYVEFSLKPEASGVRVTLMCVVRNTFPQDIPEFSRDMCVAGWEYFLQQSLKNYLDGQEKG